MESTDKVMEKCSTDSRRETLFGYLDDVIGLSHKKVTAKRGNSDGQKQGWARILITGISAYGDLLKDTELDELSKEVDEIKRRLEK